MNVSRRHFLKAGAGSALLAASGCGGAPDAIRAFYFPNENAGPFQPPAGDAIDLVSHFLNRLSFGPPPGEYARVQRLGPAPESAVQAYLDEQLNPERIDDSTAERVVRRFETLRQPLGELYEFKEKVLLDEMVRATVLRAVYSKRQLYEVMVQFWSDHFNIEPSKGDAKWLKTADDAHVVRQHALGKFPEMLRASALSPAMLWYLDGRLNRKEDAADRPNENYARELLELHTLGVHGGYTQRDVMEVARCLTGWTVRGKKKFRKGAVEFKKHLHDDGAKEVLGHLLPAGLGERDLERVLEIVGAHPSTARYLATKLCRRFIADEPPAGAIDIVAAEFARTRGDIRATLRALFATAEFRERRGNKFKRPFNYIVSALRATGAQTNADRPLIEFLLRMGHAPFHYPTPDGYPEEAAPWLGTLLWRWNFAVALNERRIKGTRLELPKLEAQFSGPELLMAHFLGRTPTAAELESYQSAGAGVALLLAGPAFQRC